MKIAFYSIGIAVLVAMCMHIVLSSFAKCRQTNPIPYCIETR